MEQENKIQGKTGVFSFNSSQAMDWLMTNKNVFTVLCYINFRMNFKKYYPAEKLNENETYICLRDIKIKPLLTEIQLKRALENLSHWGFIEIENPKSFMRVKGLKKITLLVNIFDPFVRESVQEFQNIHGGYYFQ